MKYAISLLVISLVLISGCAPKEEAPSSPKEAYLAYIGAAQKGDFVKAEQYLSSSTKENLMNLAVATGNTFDVIFEEAKLKTDLNIWGQVSQSEIYEEIEGNRAKIHMESKPGESPGFDGYYSLFKENGQWKLEMFHMVVEPQQPQIS